MAAAARFWIAYAVAWTPYFALLVSISSLQATWSQALAAGVSSGLPPAVLGVLVRPWVRRWGRPQERGWRFVGVHAASALVYATVSTAAVWALFSAYRMGVEGQASPLQLVELIFPAFVAVLLYAVLASAFLALDLQERLRDEATRRARAESLKTEAELAALRARLDPHFLFNTLHTLLILVRRDPGTAEVAIERLGEMLRWVLDEEREMVALQDEWRFAEDYLALESLASVID